MKLCLIAKGFLTYGVSRVRGKAAALFLLAAAPAAAQEVTLVAFGDSLTQGYGLIEQEGFVPQLRDWLSGQGEEVRVVNAGVSGDTTAGGAARVAWTLTPEVDAMIVSLGGNDLLRGVAPEVSRGNIETILQVAQAAGVKVLLVGMQA
ncbi:MAG TPA: GDSL-type esterase/lipase family protein, partial [Paracoccaceae bacterium]|nr:GDSL-type esterase/lipase family protein [Paracoccaceae bacterium]